MREELAAIAQLVSSSEEHGPVPHGASVKDVLRKQSMKRVQSMLNDMHNVVQKPPPADEGGVKPSPLRRSILIPPSPAPGVARPHDAAFARAPLSAPLPNLQDAPSPGVSEVSASSYGTAGQDGSDDEAAAAVPIHRL